MSQEPRAVIVRRLGKPENFTLEPHDPGAPGRGQVRIRTSAVGVSFADALIASGGYQLKPPLPFIPCSDFSGTIEAVGDGVDPERVGERVMGSTTASALAEAVVIEERAVASIPATLSLEEGAVFPTTYLTSYYALVGRAAIKAGEAVLVMGAGGATGYAATQIAKALGARVIASAASESKRALVSRGGADIVLDANAADWRDQVKAANDGRGVDIVFDPVGAPYTEIAFRTLGWKGRHLVIGFAGGQIARLPANLALLKGASLVGVDVRQFVGFEPELAAQYRNAILSLAGEGKLRPALAKCFALEDYVAAFEAAASGRLAGRVAIAMAHR